MKPLEHATPKDCFAALLLCSPHTLDALRAHLQTLTHAPCVAVLDGDPWRVNDSCDVCNALDALAQFLAHAQRLTGGAHRSVR